jgi:hypothetical protein
MKMDRDAKELLIRGKNIERMAKKAINAIAVAQRQGNESNYQRQGILCVVFMNITTNTTPQLEILKSNVMRGQSSGVCLDWAVLGYSCTDSAMAVIKIHLERYLAIELKLLSCPTDADNVGLYTTGSTTSNSFNGIPKALLYKKILHILPFYKYVWLLDEDIGFPPNFPFKKFMKLIHCSFYPSKALVIQTTVATNTQRYIFLNSNMWNDGTTNSSRDAVLGVGFDKLGPAVVSETSFIELQMPLFDTSYFEWYIQYILEPLTPAIKYYDTVWGLDEMFCKSAGYYAKVMRQPKGPVCLLITDSTCSLGHHNLKTIQKHSKHFKKRGFKLKNIISKVFPSWMDFGIKSMSGNHQKQRSGSGSSALLTHKRMHMWKKIDDVMFRDKEKTCDRK